MSPGDVVVPQDIAVDVLEEAEKIEEAEDTLREMVRSGVDVLGAFERHGMFDAVK